MITYRFPAPQLVDMDELSAEIGVAAKRDGTHVVIESDSRLDAEFIEQIIANHEPSSSIQLDALVSKARDVWAGTDTFTQAQAQKILAGLVLVVARQLR